MNEYKREPLGYVDLEEGIKRVEVMNDIFLNYTYNKRENWETLKLKTNIFYGEYISRTEDTNISLIEGDIIVDTQYDYLLDEKNVTRRQDFKVTTLENKENKETIKQYNYIEFNSSAPKALRGIEYYGLGIGHSRGKPAHQLWLVGENTDKIFENNEPFAEYVIKNKVTNKELDIKSTILFVNLKALSKENTKAGELARVLIGQTKNPEDKEVAEIFKTITSNFEEFKKDKEAKSRMTVAERYIEQGELEGELRGIEIGRQEGIQKGRQEGIQKGRAEGAEKLLKLLKEGISPEEALDIILANN